MSSTLLWWRCSEAGGWRDGSADCLRILSDDISSVDAWSHHQTDSGAGLPHRSHARQEPRNMQSVRQHAWHYLRQYFTLPFQLVSSVVFQWFVLVRFCATRIAQNLWMDFDEVFCFVSFLVKEDMVNSWLRYWDHNTDMDTHWLGWWC